MGRYDLHLSEEEFWCLVPRQFHALMERKRQESLAAEYGPALVVTAIQAMFAGKKAKKIKVTDYMPSYIAPKKEDQPWEQQLKLVKELHTALGGV